MLLDKAVRDSRRVFTRGRPRVTDRNFPGAPRIKALPEAGARVPIRARDGITPNRTAAFLPDGSYPATITGGGATPTVRVIEYQVRVAGRDAPELYCLITDLHHHQAHPARTPAAAYHRRWTGSDTTLKEARSAISGAGPSTGPMLRSGSPAMVAQEHAARSGPATASLPAALTRAWPDRAPARLARHRVTVDRNRHPGRKTKARPGFPPAGPRLPARRAPAEISACGPTAA